MTVAHETELLPNGLTTDEARDRAARAYELDRSHVFHSWSAQAEITADDDRRIKRLVRMGWRRKSLAGLLFSDGEHQHRPPTPTCGGRHPGSGRHVVHGRSPVRQRCPFRAARLIAQRTPGELNKIFFTNGGADANEHAVRMARLHTGRHKVLARYRSYHGGNRHAINLTGDPRRWPNDYGNSGVVHFFGPFLYRSHFHSTTEAEETERALAHLDEVIRLEGPSTIAAIVLETIPGTAGIMVPPPGYLAGVRTLCDRYGIVFIADEVMAGFGRSGKWFAIDHFDVTPDLLTFAKGVNSGTFRWAASRSAPRSRRPSHTAPTPAA